MQWALFHVLHDAYPEGLPLERLMRRMYPETDGPSGISSILYQANLRLKAVGMAVTARGGPGSDYRLIIGDLRRDAAIAPC
jgi:hypothetical protein